MNSGNYAPRGMLEGIRDAVDCVFFVGYHARNGTRDGILGHTWSHVKVSNVWLNGRITGEIGLNASLAAQFGAPILMISGDLAACTEAEEWIPGVEKAVVKRGTGYTAADCLPTSVAQDLIREAARRAIEHYQQGQSPAPLEVGQPVNVKLEFFHAGMADNACWMPNTTRLDGRTIEFQCATMLDAYSQFRAAVALAG